MVSVSPYPDLTGAIRAYVRSIPAVALLVGDRVWIGWPRGPDGNLRIKVPPFLDAVLIESGRGGLGQDAEAPYATERVDISCLGRTEGDAAALWRTLAPYLIDPRRKRGAGFRAANCQVSIVYQEGGPLRVPDGPTGWPRLTCGYQFRYCLIPANELGVA